MSSLYITKRDTVAGQRDNGSISIAYIAYISDEQVPGIRYQLVGARFWVTLGHDACVLNTGPPKNVASTS